MSYNGEEGLALIFSPSVALDYGYIGSADEMSGCVGVVLDLSRVRAAGEICLWTYYCQDLAFFVGEDMGGPYVQATRKRQEGVCLLHL